MQMADVERKTRKQQPDGGWKLKLPIFGTLHKKHESQCDTTLVYGVKTFIQVYPDAYLHSYNPSYLGLQMDIELLS